jgi:hypothetical protein
MQSNDTAAHWSQISPVEYRYTWMGKGQTWPIAVEAKTALKSTETYPYFVFYSKYRGCLDG